MSKSRKKRRLNRPRRNIPLLTLLRPRLDKLLGNETLTGKDVPAIKTDLDAVFKGLEASRFLPILLKAYQSAPAQVQLRLDEVIPEWLAERGGVEPLLELLKRHDTDQEGDKCARVWLEAVGADLSGLQEPQAQTLFYQAFTYTDQSQGLIIVLWYADRRRRKVRGMNFLVDFNPPWEGAIKDIMVLPPLSPQRAIEEYIGSWEQQGMPPEPLGAAEVKVEVLRGLEANRRESIRLPRDLIHSRRLFLEQVLSLPDMLDTPSFTADDFNELSHSRKTPESIRHFEQTVGRRIRIENGEEMLVIDHLPDEENW